MNTMPSSANSLGFGIHYPMRKLRLDEAAFLTLIILRSVHTFLRSMAWRQVAA